MRSTSSAEVPANARGDPESGAVTVEAAIAVCALVFVLGLVLAGFAAVSGQLRCTDAASEAARLIARGQRPLAERAVAEIAPPGAVLTTSGEAGGIRVDVRATPLGGMLPVDLHGTAYAVLEPGEGGGRASG
ncbi:TadE family type IV pilus minor pilin [Amycolatopsis minnesotensis]|uniref:TadE family type IV pilus minor pilin n=1 Tax=Amycolatopsis minnesotensis TaxID=337894 RepID=A0ABN2Q2H8_9PSEU